MSDRLAIIDVLSMYSRASAGSAAARVISAFQRSCSAGSFASRLRLLAIVILFTYLAFSRGNVFVIDEPELSLHPRWQEEFLDGVSEVMPTGTQLIIATHSPAIVGKHVNYCKTLLPYNG